MFSTLTVMLIDKCLEVCCSVQTPKASQASAALAKAITSELIVATRYEVLRTRVGSCADAEQESRT